MLREFLSKELHREQARERTRKWRIEHPNANREWCQTHKEQRKKTNRESARKHPEPNRTRARNWKINHSEQYKKNQERWRKEHSEEKKENDRKWHFTHPESRKGNNAKRRELEFIPLNKLFNGAVGHHLDKVFVVYIPRELHTSIPHNVWTGHNMELINAKAFEYLGMDEIGKPL